MNLAERLRHRRGTLVTEPEGPDGAKKYKLIKTFEGTYMAEQMKKEENLSEPIFRVFEAAKPSRGRKWNIDLKDEFDPHVDSLLDYGSIIGAKLGKPAKNYNRLLSVHVPVCQNDCWHCFVPKELYTYQSENEWRYESLTGEHIVNKFIKQRNHNAAWDEAKKSNVLRITGGEPFLVPDLIADVLNAIQKEGLSNEVFVWTETNLGPFLDGAWNFPIFDKETTAVFDQLKNHSNLAVHPCFHGLEAAEHKAITGQTVSLDEQIEAIRRMVNRGLDIYPSFGTNVCNPKHLPALLDKLRKIDESLPLRVALVRYDVDYQPVTERVTEEKSRRCPLHSHYAALRIWNDLLLRHYGLGYGVLPRHLSGVVKNHARSVTDPPDPFPDAGQEIVYLFKSPFRKLYARGLLDSLAYPRGHILTLVYDEKWVDKDLFWHMARFPEEYKGRCAVLVFIADKPEVMVMPFRVVEIVSVRADGGVLTLTYRLGSLISYGAQAAETDSESSKEAEMKDSLRHYFGSRVLPPEGTKMKLVLLGEDLLPQGTAADSSGSPISPASSFVGLRERLRIGANSGLFNVMTRKLSRAKNIKNSVYYRVKPTGLDPCECNGETIYVVKGGSSFGLEIEFSVPNYDDFTETDFDARSLEVSVSSRRIRITDRTRIVCSKYGSSFVSFLAENGRSAEYVTITLRHVKDEFQAAEVALRVRVEPNKEDTIRNAAKGSALLLLATFVASVLTQSLQQKTTPLALIGHGASTYLGSDSRFAQMLIDASPLWSVPAFGALTLLIGWLLYSLLRLNFEGFPIRTPL